MPVILLELVKNIFTSSNVNVLILRVIKMFTRRDNIQKRLNKIKKHEAKTLQTLTKQEDELKKAVDENNEMVKLFLDRESNEEKALRVEIEELSKKMNVLHNKLTEVNRLTNMKDRGIIPRLFKFFFAFVPVHIELIWFWNSFFGFGWDITQPWEFCLTKSFV